MRWRGVVGPDHRSSLLALEKTAFDAASKKKFATILMGSLGGACVVSVLVAIAVKEAAILAFLLFVGAAFAVGNWTTAADKAGKALREFEQYKAKATEFEGWLSSPEGGQLLDYVARQHPQLAS
jgi:hypothetical protein